MVSLNFTFRFISWRLWILRQDNFFLLFLLDQISWFTPMNNIDKGQVRTIDVSSQIMKKLGSFVVFIRTSKIDRSFNFLLDHFLLSFFNLLLPNFFIINELNVLILSILNLLSMNVELDAFWGEFSSCSNSKIFLHYCHSWSILAFKFEFLDYFFLLNDWNFKVKIFILLRMMNEWRCVINV